LFVCFGLGFSSPFSRQKKKKMFGFSLVLVLLFGGMSEGVFTLSNLTLISTSVLSDWSTPESWSSGVVPVAGGFVFLLVLCLLMATKGSDVGLWCDAGPSQIAITALFDATFSSLQFQSCRLFAVGQTTISLQSLVMDGNSTLYTSTVPFWMQSSTCVFAPGSSLQGLDALCTLQCNSIEIPPSQTDYSAKWSVVRFNVSGSVTLGDGVYAHFDGSKVVGDTFTCPTRSCTVSFQNDMSFSVSLLSGGFYEGINAASGAVFFPRATELNNLMLAAGSDDDMLRVFVSSSLLLTGDVTLSYL
jgi:hypothetical protein